MHQGCANMGVAEQAIHVLRVLFQGMKQGILVAPSFVAVVVAVVIWWLAYTTKTRLQE